MAQFFLFFPHKLKLAFKPVADSARFQFHWIPRERSWTSIFQADKQHSHPPCSVSVFSSRKRRKLEQGHHSLPVVVPFWRGSFQATAKHNFPHGISQTSRQSAATACVIYDVKKRAVRCVAQGYGNEATHESAADTDPAGALLSVKQGGGTALKIDG